MYYELFDSVTPGAGNVTERVEYYYGDDRQGEVSNGTEAGSPTLIVRKLMDPQTHLPTAYHGTSLAYNHQGEVGMMIERTWTESATGGPDCESETLGRGIEFLGNGRTRYGVRQREFVADPHDQSETKYWAVVDGTTLWSDYDGDEVYGDYTVTATKTWDEQEQVWVYGPPELHNVAAYLPGVGQMDSQTGAVTYHHADHLGTLRATTDGAGLVSSGLVLTAFGETVAAEGSVGTRYQYAGAWGYESALGSPGNGGAAGQTGLPWQHVGHRWYEPSTGRFLQRDPIGIGGGSNVYEYMRSMPVDSADPSGLDVWIEGDWHQAICVGSPCGDFIAFSFAVDGFFNLFNPWTNGIVYAVPGEKKPIDPNYFKKTTPQQDAMLLRMLTDLVGKEYHYALARYNCRHWVKDAWKMTDGIGKPARPPTRPKPPPPPPPQFPPGWKWF